MKLISLSAELSIILGLAILFTACVAEEEDDLEVKSTGKDDAYKDFTTKDGDKTFDKTEGGGKQSMLPLSVDDVDKETETNKSTELGPDTQLEQVSNSSNKSDVQVQHKHWTCKPYAFNQTHANQTVILIEEINVTALMTSLNGSSGCALVFFYLKWCRFSCQMASKINVIGFYYLNELPVIAVDVHKFPGLAAKYGVVGVPTVLLFHGKKPVAKFNGSSSMQDFHDFIKEMTGFVAHNNVSSVLYNDTTGPLPIVPEKRRDIYLFLSLAFLAFLCLSRIFSTEMLQSIKRTCYHTFVEHKWPSERVKQE